MYIIGVGEWPGSAAAIRRTLEVAPRGCASKREVARFSFCLILLLCGPLTRASNGVAYVAQCASCQTTADFAAAAKATAVQVQLGNGVYQVTSASVPMSAYIQVTGQWGSHNGRFSVSSAIPVDTAGHSIAGNSESSNESFYTGLDQVIFGVSRSTPKMVSEPTSYASSFINSSEEEVEPGINYALVQMGIDPGSIPAGTVITVKFEDGTDAQYVKGLATATYQWTWNGIAHNKVGQLIDRSGRLRSNPNSAGKGGGIVSIPGFGPYDYWLFDISFLGSCSFLTTIEVNGESTGYAYISPC